MCLAVLFNNIGLVLACVQQYCRTAGLVLACVQQYCRTAGLVLACVQQYCWTAGLVLACVQQYCRTAGLVLACVQQYCICLRAGVDSPTSPTLAGPYFRGALIRWAWHHRTKSDQIGGWSVQLLS